MSMMLTMLIFMEIIDHMKSSRIIRGHGYAIFTETHIIGSIAEQFEEWDHAMDNIYFDEETGQLMQSVTVHGGDVMQVPYEEDTDA